MPLKMNETDLIKIKIIYEAIKKILEFTKGLKSVEELTSNLLVWDAVKMNLVVIYETDIKLSVESKEKYSSVEWHKIQEYKPNVMNIYLGFDSDVIWKLIWEEIPEFKKRIEEIL
jgi:uncharacterized protein with HEPN domain